jgi:hypothetical protein
MKIVQVVLLMAALLVNTGCPAVSSVVTDIKVAQNIVTIGTPVVAAFTGTGSAQAQKYMGVLSTGLGCTLTAAQAAGATTATISAAFGTCFAAAIVPVLPAGTPAYVSAAINAAAAAVKILVDTYGPPAVAALQANKTVDTSSAHAKLVAIRSDLKLQLKK